VSTPTRIVYHKRSKTLEVAFPGAEYQIPAELLRVYSPSAEVRGHSAAEHKLQTGKKHVGIKSVEPVGNYAIRIVFDDGHDTGLYAWEFLEDLGHNVDKYWEEYLTDLKSANASRLPVIPLGQWSPKTT
jgi:DUF971 family protein